MRKVYFNQEAETVLGAYFENYQGFSYDNDLKIRVLHYRRIKEFLLSFDATDAKIVNGKKYIEIEGIWIIWFCFATGIVSIAGL